MRLFVLITLTMSAFAANSILTRLAVDGGYIDPSSFALIRVLSGAMTLCVVLIATRRRLRLFQRQRLAGSVCLATYMIGFSLAYLTLDAGLGALILFGVVQMTMFVHGAVYGQPPTKRQLTGATVAFAGLLLALWPGPGGQADAAGAALMVVAGLGWAAYTISGRASVDPLSATAANFVLCLPFLAILLIGGALEVQGIGLALAVVSGGLTSGLGYALWYAILPKLEQSTAAVVQLSVPILALAAGAAFLGERITPPVVVAAALVIGGIALAVTARSPQADRS